MSFVVIGAGGHSRVIIDLLRALNTETIQILSSTNPNFIPNDINVLLFEDDDFPINPSDVQMAMGIGGVTSVSIRRLVYEKFVRKGYRFPVLKHPAAYISSNVVCESGCQIMAGTMVQTGSKIGKNTLINTGAIVDHDCTIEDHCLISPGAILCGGIYMGKGSIIGPGATISQGVHIGENSLVAAGAVVINDIESGSKVQGIPAKVVKF
jgi:sugar O-acyltransferase (sialic acid O-acetyltransferase NeuD family)